MRKFSYYFGTALQLMGIGIVGVCLIAGMQKGDYEKVELYQFILGIVLFWTGHFFRRVN